MKVKVTARSWTDPAGKTYQQGDTVDLTDRAALYDAVHSGRAVPVDNRKSAADSPATDGKVK